MLITFFSAQPAPVRHLVIFSESGAKCFLILNGDRQNDIPQTNLRVEDLSQPYYNAKIICEDKTLMEIAKNNLIIADVDGVFQEVTYKIRKDKNKASQMQLNFFSMIPVQQGFIAPQNVYVVQYAQPRIVGTCQTTTKTTVWQGFSVGAIVNVVGLNRNVNSNNPYGTSITETTTTTTHLSNQNHSQNQNQDIRGCANRYLMGIGDFSSAFNTVKNQEFDENRLKTAKQIASSNCLNTNQIIQICQTFRFEETKLDFAQLAPDHCVEPQNYFKLNTIFGFSSSVDALTDYIQSRI